MLFGHVDSGKSTIAGQLLRQLNSEYANTFNDCRHKLKPNDPRMYSQLLDIYTIETEKGITVEYTTECITYVDKTQTYMFQLNDTPGHIEFIDEFIKCLFSNIYIGVLIISAKPGEYEAGINGGTTKEYLNLIRCSDITHLIVLINKIDLCDAQTRYNYIYDDLHNYIKTLKFKYLKYIPVSGYKNIGLIPQNNKVNEVNKASNVNKANKVNEVNKASNVNEVTTTFIDELCNISRLNPDNTITLPIKQLDSSDVSNQSMIHSKNKPIVLKIKILAAHNIITCGYECVSFVSTNEIIKPMNVTFVNNLKVKKDKTFIQKPFCKVNDVIIIDCIFENDITISKKTKFIFRDRALTIGFGVII